VGAVVVVSWESLATGTEVAIITDSTLVANARDVALSRLVLAQRTVAEDTIVDFMLTRSLTNSIVNLDESVTRVVLRCCSNALRAEVPVGASQALVTDANNTPVTAVTDSGVAELTTRETARSDQIFQGEVTVRAKVEGMTRVVTVLISEETTKAQVIVLSVIATDEIAAISFTTAAIAHWLLFSLDCSIQGLRWLHIQFENRLGDGFGKSLDLDKLSLHRDMRLGDHLRLNRKLVARRNRLGGAVRNDTIMNESLNQPVTIAAAR